MVVDVQLQALRSLDAVKKRGQGPCFRSVGGFFAAIVVPAGIWRSPLAAPFVVPVAIDVVAATAASGVGLEVLAPQAVHGLGVLEAVDVDDWEQVEVVLVDKGSDARV